MTIRHSFRNYTTTDTERVHLHAESLPVFLDQQVGESAPDHPVTGLNMLWCVSGIVVRCKAEQAVPDRPSQLS